MTNGDVFWSAHADLTRVDPLSLSRQGPTQSELPSDLTSQAAKLPSRTAFPLSPTSFSAKLPSPLGFPSDATPLSLQTPSQRWSSTDATALLQRGSAAENLWTSFTPAERCRPLFEALEDPNRFVAAHLVLSRERELAIGPVRGQIAAVGADAALTYDHLQVHVPIGGMTLRGGYFPSDYYYPPEAEVAGTGSADPSQIRSLRDLWLDRLSAPVVSTDYRVVAAALLVPLFFWLIRKAIRLRIIRARIEHGLCPNCGYDLKGSVNATRCSECGRENGIARGEA